MPIECEGISQCALENVFVFELYSLGTDGTYSSTTRYAEVPVSSATPQANLSSIKKNFWDDWPAEKEAAYEEWKKKNSGNSGGEQTDKEITNNDEENLRQLFDAMPDQDLPESPAYGKEPLMGWPTPKFDSQFKDVGIHENFFKPGAHGGAYKYNKISETEYVPANDFVDSKGNKTHWTGNEQNWDKHAIANGGIEK
jgi:hypothetical protein